MAEEKGISDVNGKFVVPAACAALALAPFVSFLAAAAGMVLPVQLVTGYVISEFIGAAALSLICLRIGKRSGTLGDGADAVRLLIGVVAAICFYPLAMCVSELTGRFFPSEPLEDSFAVIATGLQPWLVWVLLALLPAVSEELLCRGVLFGALRKYGALQAVVLSSIGFACMHGSIQQGAYTFLMGVIWACLRESTGSIAPGIISHLVFNTAGVMVMLEPQSGGNAVGSGFLYSYQALALLAAFGAAGGVVLLRAARQRYNQIPVGGETWLGTWPLACVCIACAVNIGFNMLLTMV